jgi:hypothetical protein
MKKNNTAEKAALDAEKITKALQESTEKNLRDIINEAIAKVVKEDDEDSKEGSFDVEDVEPDETPEVTDVETDDEVGGEEGGEEAPVDTEDGEMGAEGDEADDDEWSDMEQYKIGDDDYDFTGVDGDELLKVYNKLGDDDQIFVKKEDDGTYSVKDDETGAEFVIELNPDAMDAESPEDDETDFDIDIDPDDDSEMEIDDFGDEGGEDIPDGDDEIEIDINDDEDEDELNEENLGYTDSYQKDVFDKKPNMNEPADSKTTYSMDAGAPKDAEKPWAGKGDPKPFGEKKDTVDEDIDECGPGMSEEPVPGQDANLEEDGSGQNTKRAMKKSTNHIDRAVHNQRVASQDGEYKGLKTDVNESMTKIVKMAKALMAENKEYKKYIDRIKKALYEAAVLNVNEGRLIEILVNETTTRDEKKSILERFNAVKTISEGKALHAAIKAELSEAKKSAAPIVEKQFVAGQQSLNETTIFSNTENNPSLDLMDRMDNLYKK